jgi:hypothetical protein
MIAANRTRKAQLRTITRNLREQRRAVKRMAAAVVAPVRVQLLAAGVDAATAKRFAPAFSRGLVRAATGTTVIKLKGRSTKRVDVKLYDRARFAAKLATYRPAKDARAAAVFASAAARLAA